MELIEKSLQQTIVDMVSEHVNIAGNQEDLDTELKTMGLTSLDIIKIFVSLEKAGHIDLSVLGNNEPPRTINEIIELCQSSN